MKAYKGFSKDLSCMGYKFQEGTVNTEKEANCVKNGLHCAENPLDCLSYYPNWNGSVYYIVEAMGDIDEDGTDSKISCTAMLLIKKLTLEDFVLESLKYLQRYPLRKSNSNVKDEKASTATGFTIARGKNPMVYGAIGTVLGLAREEEDSSKVIDLAAVVVDGEIIKANTWYTVKDGTVIAEQEVVL